MKRFLSSLAIALLYGLVSTPAAIAGGEFFKQDFSNYELGDAASDWGPNAIVMAVPENKDKRRFVTTQAEGEQFIEKSPNFPPSWDLSFDVFFTERWVKMHIILTDADDNSIDIMCREENGSGYFKMPNLVEVHHGGYMQAGKIHGVKVVRKDKTIRLSWDDNIAVLSNPYPNLGKIVKFKMKIQAGTYVTNFLGVERDVSKP